VKTVRKPEQADRLPEDKSLTMKISLHEPSYTRHPKLFFRLAHEPALGALPAQPRCMRMAHSMTFRNPDRALPARRKGVPSC